MPIALVIIGLVLVITGVKNTYSEFGALVKNDFTGPNNFTSWLVALGLIGAVGYVKALRPFANAFLVLVVLVIILKNGGAFDKLKQAVAQGPVATPAQAPPPIPGNSTALAQSNQASTAGANIGTVVQLADLAAAF